MEAYAAKVVMVAFVVVLLGIGFAPIAANGQTICGMNRDGFKACEPSVSGLNPSPPSAACCLALSEADLQCFCAFKNSRFLGAYGINFDRATELPAKCNLMKSFRC